MKIPKPPLASAVETPPNGADWIHEIKWDGYRIMVARLKGAENLSFYTRSGKDWTHKFSSLAQEFKRWIPEDTIIDGELVLVSEEGGSSFSSLQEALKKEEQGFMTYYAFDLPYCQGYDLRNLPLILRKELLRELTEGVGSKRFLYSDHFDEKGEVLLENACSLNLEGIVSKRIDSFYRGGRGAIWLKSRCLNTGDFIIVGHTAPKGARSHFGSLLLATRDEEGELKYVGNVGTGFNEKTLRDLKKEFDQRAIDKSPLKEKVGAGEKIQWLNPEMIAQVKYTEWTHQNKLRHPVFLGLREDKPAEEVEIQAEKPGALLKDNITDRMLYPQIDLKKRRLIKLMEKVAPLFLEESAGHILTLLRCPQGVKGKCFFQKHPSSDDPHPILLTTIEDKEFMYIEDWEGLKELLRQNCLEIHMGNVSVEDLDRPTEFIIDLDPGDSVSWSTFVAATFDVKYALEQMNFTTFIKYTGGKGFHIHIPLAQDYTQKEIYHFSQHLCGGLEAADPDLFTINPRKKGRSHKIFLDYLRNNSGASYIAPYSLRAKPHAPIALPLDWSEIKSFSIEDALTIVDVKTILKRVNPWKRKRQTKNKLPI